MFIPKEFHETRVEEIDYILSDFPLACIVAYTQQGLIATHVPLIKKNEGILVGHIAINNEMKYLVQDHQEVLCIFKADDAYISANYYPSKFKDHKKVPTWNYQVVHIYGNLKFFEDRKSKLAAVGLLTKQQEHKVNGDSAWKMSDAPKDYLIELLEGLVVFEVEITKVLAQSKLSQNREKIDFDHVIKELKLRGKEGIAQSMLRLKSN